MKKRDRRYNRANEKGLFASIILIIFEFKSNRTRK